MTRDLADDEPALKLGALRVIARGSVMGYKGSHAARTEIASALQRRRRRSRARSSATATRIRITAQLVSGVDQSTPLGGRPTIATSATRSRCKATSRDIARGINLSLTPRNRPGLRALGASLPRKRPGAGNT